MRKIKTYLKRFLAVSTCCAVASVLLCSCGSSSVSYKNEVDVLVRDMNDISNFSIILYDMDYEKNTFSSDVYRHKYQIIIPDKDGEIDVKETGWKEISEPNFKSHVNDMGMEVASKVDGKLSKAVTPAGYSQFVGNEKYGQWEDRGGSSFWAFYGRYAMMSSLFNMMSPTPRSYYNDYSDNYRNRGRGYYGPDQNGNKHYGTSSTVNSRGNTSKWGKSQSAFKSSVQNRVSRSTGSSSTRKRVTRSSSSSYRSRGGGFGK